MKKIISAFLVLMFVCTNVYAATFATAVRKYKAGNYTGCINDLDDVAISMSKNKKDMDVFVKIVNLAMKYAKMSSSNKNIFEHDEDADKFLKEMQQIIPAESLNKFSFLFYYYALCCHQLGFFDQAKKYYAVAAAFNYREQSEIYKNSYKAWQCLEDPKSCKTSDMDEFIQSGKQVSDDIVKEKLREDLKRHKDNINAGKGLSWFKDNKEEKIAWADEGIIPEINDIDRTETDMAYAPTDEEIGKAVRTLQRAGINPMAYMNPMVNNEYAQLNALLNNGNNGYSNDYATMMMMNNPNGQISPELMQTLMRQQMMGGFGSF